MDGLVESLNTFLLNRSYRGSSHMKEERAKYLFNLLISHGSCKITQKLHMKRAHPAFTPHWLAWLSNSNSHLDSSLLYGFFASVTGYHELIRLSLLQSHSLRLEYFSRTTLHTRYISIIANSFRGTVSYTF